MVGGVATRRTDGHRSRIPVVLAGKLRHAGVSVLHPGRYFLHRLLRLKNLPLLTGEEAKC